MLCPHGGEGTQAARGLDVADDANDDDGGRLDDGDGFDNLLLVHLGTGALEVAHHVGHAGLVAEERREVHWFRRVVARKRLALASVAGGALAGQEPEGAVARVLKLAVRHWGKNFSSRVGLGVNLGLGLRV